MHLWHRLDRSAESHEHVASQGNVNPRRIAWCFVFWFWEEQLPSWWKIDTYWVLVSQWWDGLSLDPPINKGLRESVYAKLLWGSIDQEDAEIMVILLPWQCCWIFLLDEGVLSRASTSMSRTCWRMLFLVWEVSKMIDAPPSDCAIAGQKMELEEGQRSPTLSPSSSSTAIDLRVQRRMVLQWGQLRKATKIKISFYFNIEFFTCISSKILDFVWIPF